MAELRKYGVATTLLFPLIDRDNVDFETGATFAAADTQLSKNEGAFANTGSNPAHEGNGIYSLALTATEMQAARLVVTVKDQSAPKIWEDQAILIDTYGHASAQHEFDLDDPEPDANVAHWRGDVPAIVNATGDLQVDLRRWKDEVPDSLNAGFVRADLRNWLGSNPNALQSGRVDAYVGAMATAVVTATAIAADALGASELAADAVTEIANAVAAAVGLDEDAIADAILARPISNVEPAAFRTLYGAIAALVNRRRFNASGNLEVFKTDDTTVLATLTATTDPDQDPITELDP